MRQLPIFIFFLLFSLFLTFPAVGQQLVEGSFIANRTAAQLTQEIGIPLPNDIKLYKMRYETTDLFGQKDTASGLLVVPDYVAASFPLIVYQHGTVGEKSQVPSNLQSEAVIAMACASLGYATIAPDYLGLGDSRGFHPYVHAETEASVAIDMLYALEDYAPSISLTLNEHLFVTGYSQGGHAAMALARELEANYSQDFPLTATAPMSGPYSISGVMVDQLFINRDYFYPSYLPYTLNSYQMAYGNIYTHLNEIYRPGYDSLVQRFLDRQLTLGQLNSSLVNKLTQDFGQSNAREMFLDSVQTQIRTDSMHPFNVAMRLNDVYDWTPQAPLRMFYCEADDQVFFQNSILADSVMNARGAADVEARSVGTTLDHEGCATPAGLQTIFFFNSFLPFTSIESRNVLPLYWHIHQQEKVFEFELAENRLEKATFSLVDIHGKNIFSQQIELAGRQQIPLGTLSGGIYVIEIISETSIWRKKVFVE